MLGALSLVAAVWAGTVTFAFLTASALLPARRLAAARTTPNGETEARSGAVCWFAALPPTEGAAVALCS
eukprot:5610011-Prymnesium_polylepis.1